MVATLAALIVSMLANLALWATVRRPAQITIILSAEPTGRRRGESDDVKWSASGHAGNGSGDVVPDPVGQVALPPALRSVRWDGSRTRPAGWLRRTAERISL